MRYRYRDSSGEDEMEIETTNEQVTKLTWLVDPPSPAYTAETLQHDLALYKKEPGMTLEDALAAYAGGYGRWRKVED